MQKNIFIIPVFTILSLINTAYCIQNSGIFLELPVSVRASGMAESYTVLANDAEGIYYNPAGIGFAKISQLSFNYQQHILDLNANIVSLTFPLINDITVGVSATYLGMKEEPIYDASGKNTGRNYGFRTFIVPLTAAYTLGNFSLGTTVKYYAEEETAILSSEWRSVNVITVDAGTIYRLNGFRLGISALNTIGQLYETSLPTTIKAGIGYVTPSLIITTELDSLLSREEMEYTAGIEIPVSGILFIRAGYKLNGKSTNSTLGFGLGIKIKDFRVDYAYTNQTELGSLHKFGLALTFTPPTEKVEPVPSVPEPTKPIPSPSPVPKPVLTETEVKRSTYTIAVMNLEAQSVSASDALVISDLLRTAIINTNIVNIVERGKLDQIMAESRLQQTGCTDQECAIKLGRLLNAQKVIVGSVGQLGTVFLVNIRFVDVETGRVEFADKGRAQSLEDIEKTVEDLATRLVSRIVP